MTKPIIEDLKSGLSRNTIFAILYSSLILTPAILYMRLSAGVTLSISYIVILLFTEIGFLFGHPLTKQEVTVILYTAPVAASGSIFLDWCVRRGYWVVSPISRSFNLHFPTWWAPPADSSAYQLRTLFHPDWILPISILLTAFTLQTVIELSLGLIFAHLFIEVEDLPFPLQRVDVVTIETLAEREPQRIRLFALCSLVGGTYAFILYGLPTVLAAYGRGFQLIPVPWADGTNVLEQFLPGASIGIVTDLAPYVTGFVIPFQVVVWQLIGSIFISIVGNHLALKIPNEFFRQWQESWLPSSSIMYIYQQSYLHLWISPLVGLAIAAALGPLIAKPSYLINTFKGLSSMSKIARKAGYLPLSYLLIIYIGASIGIMLLYINFVPGFPILYLLTIVLAWPFLYSMINARAIGLTGYEITIPYVNEMIMLSSGYPGIEKFLVPVITGPGAAYWVARLKVCKLTYTKPTSVYGAYIIAWICALISSLIYVNMFWSLAPIPSMFYPYTMYEMPLGLINGALWLTGRILSANPMAMISAFIAGLAVQIITTLFKLPISLLGFYLGASQPIPGPLAVMVGSLLGRYLFPKIFGQKWWENNRLLIVGGIICGEVVCTSLVAAISIMTRALWSLPF